MFCCSCAVVRQHNIKLVNLNIIFFICILLVARKYCVDVCGLPLSLSPCCLVSILNLCFGSISIYILLDIHYIAVSVAILAVSWF